MAAQAPPAAVQAVALPNSVAALARSAFSPGAAEPLGSQDVVLHLTLQPNVRDAIERSRTSVQLRNDEAMDLLHNYEQYGFRAGQELPAKPPGGTTFLVMRDYCHQDGHDYSREPGGSVAEMCSKLQVDGEDALECYLARTADGELERRRYALLEGGSGVMLVHYLARATAPRTPVPDSTESDETVRAQMHGHSSSDACPTCGNPEPTGWQFNCDTMMAECDKCGVQLPTWLHVL